MTDNTLNKQLFSGEAKMIRTILISSFSVIGICILLYFVYILLGEFFTTIFFSVIISMAIKPTKEYILTTMQDHIDNNNYSISNCYLFTALGYIIDFILLISNSLVLQPSSNSKLKNGFSNLKITELVSLSCIVYIILTKIELSLTITLFINIILFDVVIRLIFDTIMLVFGVLKNTNLNHFIYNRNNFNEAIHSVLSISLIFVFIGLISCVLAISMWLCYIDFRSILTIINDNNGRISSYLGDIIPESVKSYYENDLTYNNVHMKLKVFDDFFNITEAETQLRDLRNSNHTIWEISSELFGSLAGSQIINQNKKEELLHYIEDKCELYKNDTVFNLIGYTGIEYIKNVYCGTRIISDKFNIIVRHMILTS
jgi:hypothetical protein